MPVAGRAPARSTQSAVPEGAHDYHRLMRDARADGDSVATMPDDTAVILYTSGTTGRPKGAEPTHFNLFYNAEYFATKLVPLDSTSVSLAVLPLFHSFGQTVVQNGTLSAGGTIVLLPRFEPKAAFELMHAHNVTLFAGVPTAQVRARAAAGAWLASTGRTDDVLLGYEPVFLQAWESNRAFSRNVIPRADPRLFASTLRGLDEPLGRGVWVLDASDTTNVRQRQTIPFARPTPHADFDARVFGPYLVIRSRRPLQTPARYVTVAKKVMRLGRSLGINDADDNLKAVLQAESRL